MGHPYDVGHATHLKVQCYRDQIVRTGLTTKPPSNIAAALETACHWLRR